MMRYIRLNASMRAKHFLGDFNNNRIYGEDLAPVKRVKALRGLCCCSYYSGGSGVVDPFFIGAPNVCGGSVFDS